MQIKLVFIKPHKTKHASLNFKRKMRESVHMPTVYPYYALNVYNTHRQSGRAYEGNQHSNNLCSNQCTL